MSAPPAAGLDALYDAQVIDRENQTHPRRRRGTGLLGQPPTFERMGWCSVMRNGAPHWVPPDWLDPTRKPIKNRMHD